MKESGSRAETLTFEQLAELRQRTEAIAGFLRGRLQGYLETLRPLLAPRRLLGKYVDQREDMTGSDRAARQVREKFAEVCGDPLGLTPDLDDDVFSCIDNSPEIHAWEYTYEAKAEGETRRLTITSPVRWVLTYGSGYSLSQMRQAVAARHDQPWDQIRQFVVNALVMYFLFAKYPKIGQVFSDLHYHVQTDKCPGLGIVPFVTVSAYIPSFRPADNLILKATRLSGVPDFVELIDAEAVQTLRDPLKERIEELLR